VGGPITQATTWGVPQAVDAPIGPDAFAERAHESLDAILSSHGGASRPSYAVAGTVWRDTDTGQLYLYDGTTDAEIAVNAGAPASATTPGAAGQIAWDANYLYICTAASTWKRAALSNW